MVRCECEDRPGLMKHLQQQPALELRGLTKHFDRPAVDALDLTVAATWKISPGRGMIGRSSGFRSAEVGAVFRGPEPKSGTRC
jgi:hypothetical protein